MSGQLNSAVTCPSHIQHISGLHFCKGTRYHDRYLITTSQIPG